MVRCGDLVQNGQLPCAIRLGVAEAAALTSKCRWRVSRPYRQPSLERCAQRAPRNQDARRVVSRRELAGAAGTDSLKCGRQIRKAFVTGVAQP